MLKFQPYVFRWHLSQQNYANKSGFCLAGVHVMSGVGFNNLTNRVTLQVQQLQKQVISLGGQLEHSGPVEPSVDVILQDMGGGGAPTSKGNRRKRLGSESKSNRSSKSVTPATTNGQSDIAAEISVLLSENEMLKKKLTSLEAHVGSGKEKVPLVLRQPSVLFALSSVHNMENGTPEDR